MAALVAALRVINIPSSGAISIQYCNSVSYMRVHWKLGSPGEDIEYRVVGTDVGVVTPGLAPGTTRIIEPSLDGGGTVEARMLSTGAQMLNDLPMSATETGVGTGSVLATTPVPRFTAQQITVGDCFNGKLNQIKTTSGDMIAPGGILPDVQGLDKVTIGLPNTQQDAYLHFAISVDQTIRNIRVDIDMDRQYIYDAITHVIERMGSLVDPEHAQFYIDSGDYPAVGATPQTVVLGNKPTTAHLTFTGTTATGVNQMILRGSQAQGQNKDMCASAGFKGGQTTHGFPVGGKFTRIVTLNHQGTDATGDYKSGLAVVGVYVNRDMGGVGYLPGDGAYHPMSQAMGVNDLWYDETASELNAATDAGVYRVYSDPATATTAPWPRLGNMALITHKLVKDGGFLYALVEFQNTSVKHILRYPGTDTGHGYDGWDDIFSLADIVDFSVTGTILYYIAGTLPIKVWAHTIGSSAFDTPITLSTLNLSSAMIATGLDVIAQDSASIQTVTGTFVRTSSGGQGGLFYIAAGSVNALAAGDGLKDAFGAPVAVNRICVHPPGRIAWSTGAVAVKLFAATNQGAFVTDSDSGNRWRSTSGQNNLGDINLMDIAGAPARPWLGRMLTRIHAINDQSYYLSNNGTINWVDMTAQLLDGGPTFFAGWKKKSGVYPTNIVTQLPWPDPVKGPYTLVRQLDGIGGYDYVLYNYASAAPAGAHRYAEIPTISAPALLPEIQASQVLVDAKSRFLAWVSKPQLIVEIQSVFSDTADPLRTLRPTHMAKVNGVFEECFISASGPVTIGYVTYSNLIMFVLEHEMVYDATADPNSATTRTRLGVFLLEDRSDPNKVISDLSYAQSRTNLYNLIGRR